MWIANRNSGTVTKLRANDGTVLGTFPTQGPPYGVAFDGTYVWVSGDSYMLILRASDGAQVALRTLNAAGVAFDGAYVWTAETNGDRLLKF